MRAECTWHGHTFLWHGHIKAAILHARLRCGTAWYCSVCTIAATCPIYRVVCDEKGVGTLIAADPEDRVASLHLVDASC
jgi:hypothetical protein